MSDELKELSEAMADAAATAGNSVVRVNARRRLPASGIVWSADGLIVTASHVVQDEEEITVGLANGDEVAGSLVGRDPMNDLALLRVEASELAAPAWVEPGTLRAGQLVLAVGRPGQDIQTALGAIRSPNAVIVRTHHPSRSKHGHRHHGHGREGEHHAGPSGESYVLPDVVMYPGFSGGPLVAATGQIIGMNTSAFRGATLTIPQTVIGSTTQTLVEYGRMRQGYLGISAQPVRLPDAQAEEYDQETGLLLVLVEPDSPASRAELLLGDTIIALDGIPTTTLDELLGLLRGERVGQTVTATILRGGQIQEVSVTIGERM